MILLLRYDLGPGEGRRATGWSASALGCGVCGTDDRACMGSADNDILCHVHMLLPKCLDTEQLEGRIARDQRQTFLLTLSRQHAIEGVSV